MTCSRISSDVIVARVDVIEEGLVTCSRISSDVIVEGFITVV